MKTDREAVIEVFVSDLPYTARMMNVGALTEEIIFGRDAETPDDDERPAESIYDRYRDICEQLAREGILNEGEALGITIYYLTPEVEQRYNESVLRWLDNGAKRARENEDLKAMNAFEAAAEIIRGVEQ